MSKLIALLAGAAAFLAVPAITLLALVAVTGSALACPGLDGVALAATAPVPPQARLWIALAHSACPALPQPWVAAVMAQESGFQPTAHADDRNGGTWGLLQLNASIWQANYGARWDADLNHNGVPDIDDPEIHATLAGTYLCHRLAQVRRVRAQHPDWTSTLVLSELDELLIAHNAGESRLATYPNIPAVTQAFLVDVHAHSTAWSTAGSPVQPASAPPPQAQTVAGECRARTSIPGSVVLPPGTPVGVATAVLTALDYVGVRAGWHRACDRLACRAYAYANSGYASAAAHWATMLTTGHAHPQDRCPPVGAFAFWSTNSADGHVALVVQSDPTCDPDRIKLVSNDVLDSGGTEGGVYLVSLTQIEQGFVTRTGYLGWSDPVCAGAALNPS